MNLADEKIHYMRGSNDPADAMHVIAELIARGYTITICIDGGTVTATAKRGKELHRAAAKSPTRAAFNLAYEIVRCPSGPTI